MEVSMSQHKLERVTPPIPYGTRVALVDDAGVVHITRTRSDAWTVADGIWVVLVEGRTGGYRVDRLFLLPDNVLELA